MQALLIFGATQLGREAPEQSLAWAFSGPWAAILTCSYPDTLNCSPSQLHPLPLSPQRESTLIQSKGLVLIILGLPRTDQVPETQAVPTESLQNGAKWEEEKPTSYPLNS